MIIINKRKASNMKKNGFTLAEVLITLGIVGFIASITIPSLVVSTTNRQSAAAFKKCLYTISNAAAMSSVTDGRDFSSIDNTNSINDILKTANTLSASELGKLTLRHTFVNHNGNTATNQAVFFRDGTALLYPTNRPVNNRNGIGALIDVNGIKAPNRMSKCRTVNCNSASDKIYDIFEVKLMDSRVLPNSPG